MAISHELRISIITPKVLHNHQQDSLSGYASPNMAGG